MATVIVISIPAVACAFMIYILVQFYIETKSTRRTASQPSKAVIAFRNGFVSRQGAGEPRSKGKATGFAELNAKKASLETPMVVPVGIRRRTSKRVARS